MSNLPRRHHYVPRFYLAGFTDSGTEDGTIHVLDQSRCFQKPSNPNGVAHQRDFYAVDLGPTTNPMIVEKTLGDWEGHWSCIVRKVVEMAMMPTGEEFAGLMHFIAVMATRTPRIRQMKAEFLEEVRKKEQFAQQWYQQKGIDIEIADPDGFSEINQTWHVKQMLHMAEELQPMLCRRVWNVWTANDNAPDLICSDYPVALMWYRPVHGPYSPGFGTRNTVLTIPLNKRIALASMLELDLGFQQLDRAGVADMNSKTAMSANQLYSAQADFVWQKSDYSIGTTNDLLDALRRD